MASPTFVVDTSILILHIRHKGTSPSIYYRAIAKYGLPVASEISVYEIEVGGRKANRVDEFATNFGNTLTFPVDRLVALKAAEIDVELRRQNQIIGISDTLIAATALIHQLPLLTINTKHFSRVTGLKLLQVP